jgi:hypothetical protein
VRRKLRVEKSPEPLTHQGGFTSVLFLTRIPSPRVVAEWLRENERKGIGGALSDAALRSIKSTRPPNRNRTEPPNRLHASGRSGEGVWLSWRA